MRTISFRLVATLAVVLLSSPAFAAGPARYLNKPDDWFASEEGKRIAANILSHQSDLGGWPKNTDTTVPFTGDRTKIQPTFDNGATTDELRFLARAFAATKDETDRTAFDKGLAYILKAQYSNGGWPQFYPPPEKTYHRHITFNDNAMVRLVEFLREVATLERYRFVADAVRKDARAAFDRGVGCILKCQVSVDGKLTVWCAQHDEKDFSPRPARTYELVSLSGAESVGITRLLMSLENPGPEVVRSVEAAAAWFVAAKLTGIRVDTVADAKSPSGKNKVVVKDPKAPPLWARFYEIGTNRPIFSDRDGVKKFDLAEIGYERRNGYAWYGTWPQKLLDEDYPAWKKRVSAEPKK
ncbi:MAG TPA: pectate lyase [Gemmataceae bacterium]|nr:pectate lyase [Gemmataceae bacterium]